MCKRHPRAGKARGRAAQGSVVAVEGVDVVTFVSYSGAGKDTAVSVGWKKGVKGMDRRRGLYEEHRHGSDSDLLVLGPSHVSRGSTSEVAWGCLACVRMSW